MRAQLWEAARQAAARCAVLAMLTGLTRLCGGSCGPMAVLGVAALTSFTAWGATAPRASSNHARGER